MKSRKVKFKLMVSNKRLIWENYFNNFKYSTIYTLETLLFLYVTILYYTYKTGFSMIFINSRITKDDSYEYTFRCFFKILCIGLLLYKSLVFSQTRSSKPLKILV